MSQNLPEIRAGEDVTLRLTFTDANGDLENLTGSTAIEFRAANDKGDRSITKTLAAGQISILAQSGATLGVAEVTVNAADTANWPDTRLEVEAKKIQSGKTKKNKQTFSWLVKRSLSA